MAGDLRNVTSVDNKEKLVSLNTAANSVVARYIKQDMVPLYGSDILVRESVAKKLFEAQNALHRKHAGWQFLIVYGYRSPDVQQQYFLERKKELSDRGVPTDRLEEEVHKLVAVPEVAGHPTGGAIDVTIIDRDSGSEIDMGGHIADFKNLDLIPTYSGLIAEAQLKNRLLLHSLLTGVGFAPFYGEWWHFSYGDKEWAFFYDRPNAVYDQISLKQKAL